MNKETSIGKIEGGMFTRHAKSARHGTPEDPLSDKFTTLTEKGVEQARNTARAGILPVIEKAPAGTVFFIGGKSDQARTGDTAGVYGEELKVLAESRGGFKVLTQSEIDEERQRIRTDRRREKIIDEVAEAVNASPETKVVVTYPLHLNELSYAYDNRWITTDQGPQKGQKTDYFDQLVKKYKGDHAPCVADWIENQGRLEMPDGSTLQGPKPEKVAKEYLRGLARLEKFVKKQLPGRPVSVLGVGHQWDLDAVASYLAQGKVDTQSFEEVSGSKVISEAEMVSNVTISDDGRSTVDYRGRHFEFDLKSS